MYGCERELKLLVEETRTTGVESFLILR